MNTDIEKFVIIPSCSDLNRGDQALFWETKNIAEESGHKGKFYLIAEQGKDTEQTKMNNIDVINAILEHPSRKDKNKENVNYNLKLKIKWGLVSVFDGFFSLLLLNKYIRKTLKKFLKSEKQFSLKILEESNAVFVKGGGFIHSYGGIVCFYHMYYSLYHIFLSGSMGKKIYIMPNSFGPFKGIGVKWIVKKALKKCVYISSRESISTEMLNRDLNIKVKTMPDLAFFLKKNTITKDQFILKYNINNKKTVAITMRPYRFPSNKNPEKAYKNYILCLHKFIYWLYEENYMPIIVEHTLAIRDHESDMKCIEAVLKDIPKNYYSIISDRNMTCKDLKGIYANCDYIVGTRFHSVIFSLAEHVPGIAITYGGNKGKGIMRDIGIEDYAIPIEELNYEDLKNKFTSLITNENAIKDKISNYLVDIQPLRQEIINSIGEY